MKNRIVFEFIKYIVAGIFIFSAILKTIDFKDTVDYFAELLKMDVMFIKLCLSAFIIGELVTVVLLFHFTCSAAFNYILGFLFFFTDFSLFMLHLNAENCVCFGTKILTDPGITLAKNILLILLVVSLKRSSKLLENSKKKNYKENYFKFPKVRNIGLAAINKLSFAAGL